VHRLHGELLLQQAGSDATTSSVDTVLAPAQPRGPTRSWASVRPSPRC